MLAKKIGEENIELEALRALQYEGTSVDNALNFKKQGNELVKEKKWKDAKEFYSKGLTVLTQSSGAAQNGHTESRSHRQQEEQAEKSVKEACLVNRALCNLELQNYRSTTLDCIAALHLNGGNVKAYYRCALALYALNKPDQASDACLHGLIVDKSNVALKNLMEKIAERSTKKTEEEEKKWKARELKEKKKIAVWEAMEKRGLRKHRTERPPELEDAVIHMSPDPLNPESRLCFPVMLLYPMHAQSDFIKAVEETDWLGRHLEYILPPPWDTEKEYEGKRVELYAETIQGGLTKVGKDLSLLEILKRGGVEIVDELVKIYVLPRGKAGGWIAEMKKRKALTAKR